MSDKCVICEEDREVCREKLAKQAQDQPLNSEGEYGELVELTENRQVEYQKELLVHNSFPIDPTKIDARGELIQGHIDFHKEVAQAITTLEQKLATALQGKQGYFEAFDEKCHQINKLAHEHKQLKADNERLEGAANTWKALADYSSEHWEKHEIYKQASQKLHNDGCYSYHIHIETFVNKLLQMIDENYDY